MNLRLPFLCASVLILSFAIPNTAEVQADYSEEFLSAIHQFSTDFSKAVTKETIGNFVISPFSLFVLLSMVAVAAEGVSKEEVVNATHLPMTRDNLEYLKKLLTTLNSASGAELHLASKLFVQNDFPINPAFLSETESKFNSKAESIDFKNTNEAAAIINKWAEDQTNNQIHNLINAHDLDRTVLMLLNAVFFKGTWKFSFDSELKQKNFYSSDGNSTLVPMICNNAPYYQRSILDGKAGLLELPYEDNSSQNEFSAFLIVPTEIGGLPAVIEKMRGINFSTDLSSKNTSNTTVCMPKFKIESEHKLIPLLQKMGINSIFSDNANLSNIGSRDDLVVNQVVQKAEFSVDEKGSQAAAATAIGVGTRSIGSREFIFNQPGMIAIVHKITGIPLFIARLSDPQSQSA